MNGIIPLIKDLKLIVIEYLGTDLVLDFRIDLYEDNLDNLIGISYVGIKIFHSNSSREI